MARDDAPLLTRAGGARVAAGVFTGAFRAAGGARAEAGARPGAGLVAGAPAFARAAAGSYGSP